MGFWVVDVRSKRLVQFSDDYTLQGVGNEFGHDPSAMGIGVKQATGDFILVTVPKPLSALAGVHGDGSKLRPFTVETRPAGRSAHEAPPGAASTSGQAGTAAGATRSVPLLRPAPDIHEWCYQFEGFPPRQPAFFLDAGGQLTSSLEVWVEQNAIRFREGSALRPLLITGPIKAGKSFTLNKVLPAIAVKYASANSLPDPTFLTINCERVTRGGGSSKCLSSLLANLLSAAKAAGLQQAADTPPPRDVHGGDVLTTLLEFMDRLPRDRINYLLLDEVQRLYLLLDPTAPAAQRARVPPLDLVAIMEMRDYMKPLFLSSPPWVAWGITGSAMATLLVNVALTPANGTALLLDNYRVVLPGAVNTDLMQVAWGQLLQHYNDRGTQLPPELVWCAPPNHAMLAYMCDEWTLRQPDVSTADELVRNVKLTKLVPEALLDLRVVLEMLPAESGLLEMLLAMTDPTAGVSKAALLPLLLEPLKAFGAQDALGSGSLNIENPLYTELLRLITTEDGKLVSGILDRASIPALTSYVCRQLATLGDLCTGRHELVNQLMASMVEVLDMDTDTLIRQLWFQEVLKAQENSYEPKNGTSATQGFYRALNRNPPMEPSTTLSWFHRLLRNVLVHGTLKTQAKFLNMYPKRLSVFIENGRVKSVLTDTFAPQQLPGAIGKKQPPIKALLGAAKQQRALAMRQRLPARCALGHASASSQACVRWR